MALQFTTSQIEDALTLFRQYKRLAERAMEQVTDEQLLAVIDAENNSVALTVKHMAGNMKSRWTDFLTSDGEKPDRDRDQEFENPPQSRTQLMEVWARGWECVMASLEGLTDADLGRTVTIRGEAHSVMQAIQRQLCHYAYHTGQIVLLCKHFGSTHWKALTIAKGESRTFNEKVTAGETSQR